MMKNKFGLISAIASLFGCIAVFAALAMMSRPYWISITISLSVVALFLLVIVVDGLHYKKGVDAGSVVLSMILLGGIFPSLFNAQIPLPAYRIFFEVLSAVMAFVLSCYLFSSFQCRAMVVKIMMVAVLVQFLVMSKQFISGNSGGALEGTMTNANVNALFHLLWLPVFTSQIKPAGLRNGILLLALCNLLFSKSVSAWLCLALFFPMMVDWPQFRTFAQKNRRVIFLIAGAGVVFMAYLVGIKIKEQLGDTGMTIANFQSTSRLIWWKSGFRMFNDFPFWGIGLGNYPHAYLAYKAGQGLHTLYPHSVVVGLLSETGLSGFSAVLLCFALWIRQCLSNAEAAAKIGMGSLSQLLTHEKKPFVLGVCMAVAFCLVNVGFEYFGIKISLAMIMGMALADHSSQKWQVRWPALLAAGILIVAALVWMVRPYMAHQRTEAGSKALETGAPLAEAELLFQSAVSLNPYSFSAYNGLAKVSWKRFLEVKKTDDLEWAVTFQRQAVKLNKFSAGYWWELGAYYEAAQDWPLADHAFETAARFDTNKKFYAQELNRFRAMRPRK